MYSVLWNQCNGGLQSKETWAVDLDCSHLYKHVPTLSTKAVPLGVKGLEVAISINLAFSVTKLIRAIPPTLITDTVRV